MPWLGCSPSSTCHRDSVVAIRSGGPHFADVAHRDRDLPVGTVRTAAPWHRNTVVGRRRGSARRLGPLARARRSSVRGRPWRRRCGADDRDAGRAATAHPHRVARVEHALLLAASCRRRHARLASFSRWQCCRRARTGCGGEHVTAEPGGGLRLRRHDLRGLLADVSASIRVGGGGASTGRARGARVLLGGHCSRWRSSSIDGAVRRQAWHAAPAPPRRRDAGERRRQDTRRGAGRRRRSDSRPWPFNSALALAHRSRGARSDRARVAVSAIGYPSSCCGGGLGDRRLRPHDS